MVWAADPFPGDTRTVNEIIEERPQRSFVMYAIKPSRRQVQAFNRCVAMLERREKPRSAK
jgi:hypothetical protein